MDRPSLWDPSLSSSLVGDERDMYDLPGCHRRSIVVLFIWHLGRANKFTNMDKRDTKALGHTNRNVADVIVVVISYI